MNSFLSWSPQQLPPEPSVSQELGTIMERDWALQLEFGSFPTAVKIRSQSSALSNAHILSTFCTSGFLS